MPRSKPDPGRVTARRLNRNEYTNTIRDLLGVDFRAERDFPTDDSGYGFDNIGDVLTMSPLLMERYMSAAERIAALGDLHRAFRPSRSRSSYLARERTNPPRRSQHHRSHASRRFRRRVHRPLRPAAASARR